MLQMNCTNCGGLIKSPLLAEVQLFVCPQCEAIIVVNDVVITQQKPSVDLRASLKNILLSARDKFQLYKASNSDLQVKYAVDKRLAKLLRRDDFRLKMSYDYFVQLNFNYIMRPARLLNISSTGAAIDLYELGQLPENDAETKFQLHLPGHSEPLSLRARVVWSRKPAKGMMSPTISMGLQFKDTDEQARSCLWDFIVNAETATHT